MSNKHVIGRQRFRFRTAGKTAAEIAFSKTSDLVRNRLTHLLNEIFTEFFPGEEIIRIDKLRLDIGEISADNFEEEVTERVLKQLREQLENITSGKATASKVIPKPVADYELLAFFLQHGRLPWQADKEDIRSPSELLVSVLKASPKHLLTLLGEVIAQPNIFTRLVFQFTPDSLRAVNNHFLPKGWNGVEEDIAFLLALHRLKPLPSTKGKALTERLFLAVVTRLIVSNQANNVSAKDWPALLVTEVAIQRQIPAPYLMEYFSSAAINIPTKQGKRWPAAQVARVVQSLSSNDVVTPPDHQGESAKRLREMVSFIKKGATPTSGAFRTEGAMEALLRTWLINDPVGFQPVFRRMLEEEVIRNRIHQAFNWPTILAIHQWNWKAYWPKVIAYLNDLKQLMQQATLPAFSEDYLRRTVLSDWLGARLAGPSPTSRLPAGGTTTPTDTPAQIFWSRLLTNSLQQLARESGRSLTDLMQGLSVLMANSKTVWESDFPTLITSEQSPVDQSTFGKELPAKAVVTFRFFLEQGFLPEGFSKAGMANLQEDIYQRALSGSDILFNMLSTVIEDKMAFSRFRRDVAPKVLYALAAQLVNTRNVAPEILQELPDEQDQPSGTLAQGYVPDTTKAPADTPPEQATLAPDSALDSEQPDPNKAANTRQEFADQRGKPSATPAQEDVPDTTEAPADTPPSEQTTLAPDSALDPNQPDPNKAANTRQEFADQRGKPSSEGLIGDTNHAPGAIAGSAPPHPASNRSLHLRPRPDLPTDRQKGAVPSSPWAVLFDHLNALYPDEPSWQIDQEIYLRHSHSFFVRQQLRGGKSTDLTLPALVKEWAEIIALVAEQPWPVMAAYLNKAATTITGLPQALRNALLQAAGLSPEAILAADTTKTSTEPAPALFHPKPELSSAETIVATTRAAQAWADWMTQAKSAEAVDESLLTSTNFDHLIADVSAERTTFIKLIADKKILPDRLLDRFSFRKVRKLVNLLVADLLDEHTDWMAVLDRLMQGGDVYDQRKEAGRQLNRYALFLLLGSDAAPHRLDTFTEQLLAMVAKEQGQTTIALVTALDRVGKKTKAPPAMQRLLQRIVARIPAAAIKKIQAATVQQQKSIVRISSASRVGALHRATLEYYLEKGESPWWSSSSERPDQLFLQAVEADAAAVSGMLAEAPTLADKLFPFLPDQTLRTFVIQVFPTYGDFLFAWTEAIQALQEKQLLPTRDGLRLAWLPVWNYTLKASAFSSTGFVKFALQAVIKASGTDRATLHRLLTGEVNDNVHKGGARYSRLAVILAEENPTTSDISLPLGTGTEEELPVGQQGDNAGLPGIASGVRPDHQAGETGATNDQPLAPKKGEIGASTAGAEPGGAKKSADAEKEHGPLASGGAAAGAREGSSKSSEEEEVSEEAATSYADELTMELSRLRHFFFYGTPPSGKSSISRQAFEVFQERIIRLHPELATTLYRTVLADKIARDRLVRYFSVDLWREVLQLLLGSRMQWVERLWADLSLLLPGVLPQFRLTAFREDAMIQLLAFPSAHSSRPDLTTYPEYLLERPARQGGTALTELFNKLKINLQQPPPGLREDWTQVLGGIQQRKVAAVADAAGKKSNNGTHSMEESMYIHNSGLVILVAYFKRYFGMLDMLDGSSFRTEEDAVRGVLLLEYLASGRTEVEEHELVFNKVLCGLDVTTPVPAILELTEQEAEISEQMLNAILQNWNKMSTSTIENLRGSFLLREGLLQEHGEHWSLNVSSAGYDVLLSFLPWTISVISLPWMEKRLEVEWNTNMS